MKISRVIPPRPASSVTGELITKTEKTVTRLRRQKNQPREIPQELWPRAVSVIERAELSALETAIVALKHRSKKTRPSTRDTMIHPTAGWSSLRRRHPVPRLGLVLDRLPSLQAPLVLAASLAARAAGVEMVIGSAPDEPQGGVSALVLAAAHLTDMDRFVALPAQAALVGLGLGLWGLPRCDLVIAGWSPLLHATAHVLEGLAPGRILLTWGHDLVVVAEGEADPDQIVIELAAHAERFPQGRRGVLSPSRSLVKTLRKATKEHNLTSDHSMFLVTVSDMAEALDRVGQDGNDTIWLLVAQPDAWAERLGPGHTVLVGPHSPPSLLELAVPPPPSLGPGPAGPLGPVHLLQEGVTEQLSLERHKKLALSAARIAESEFRPLSAKAAAWVRHGTWT